MFIDYEFDEVCLVECFVEFDVVILFCECILIIVCFLENLLKLRLIL